jgi:hypothetical protein
MNKYILIMSTDWVDEFNCEEFRIVNTLKEAEQIRQRCIDQGGDFGTNEGFEEEELSEDAIEIKVITQNEASIIQKTLGGRFGTGIL